VHPAHSPDPPPIPLPSSVRGRRRTVGGDRGPRVGVPAPSVRKIW
jgi:hypothetical protein